MRMILISTSDLQPVSERGYVSLKKAAPKQPAAAEAEDKDSAAEKPAEEVLADDTEVPEKEDASVQPEAEISDK